MAPPAHFPDLPPDAVFSIFAHCDISTVVSTSQTCRYLHDLAFEKGVWLALVNNLRRRAMLDQNRTPTIENMSMEELIQVVKRIVAGPESWSPQNPASAAKVHTRITLHPDVRTGDGILHWENMAKLLPSGRHLLYTNNMKLEFRHRARIGTFAAEETEGGDALVIMVCLRTYPPGAQSERNNHVEIIRLDLQSGVPDTLLSTRVPNSSHDNPFSLPLIRGALALVATSTEGGSYMILNWMTKSYFMLKCRPVRPNTVLLLPQHLILKTPSIRQDENDEEDEIHIIAHDALRPYWVPTSSIGPTGDFASVRPHNLQKLSTIATPMQPDNEYRLWVHASDENGPGYVGALVGYQLSLGRDGVTPSWRCLGLVTRLPAPAPEYPSTIPYSGHILSLAGSSSAVHISPTRSSTAHATVDVPDSGDYVDVAQYSGALTYSTHDSIVITYFR
ncbi:hypothetical protein DFH06DRAFT_1396574 [Mycena polygramma]|nr:hypothetical protein DFH06DRAFT_1396574 [Mycena polygramma]